MAFGNRKNTALIAALLGVPLLSACSAATEQTVTPQMQERYDELSSLFKDANVTGQPSLVDCTLSGGTETKCFSITTGAAPANHETGPYCPINITDSAEDAGTWFVNNELYDVDGKFIEQLAVIYKDDEWQMFDTKTGQVTRAAGELGCEVAGDPTSAADYKNYCVECEVKYLDSNSAQTYVIPLAPLLASESAGTIGPQTGIGLAFNGVKLDAPAPLNLILGSHTLGLFDSCAGHVNPTTGYHYHGLVGCEPQLTSEVEGHAPKVAVAMDGYDIYAQISDGKSGSLDTCGGHETDGIGYHYHTEKAGTNQFIGCFKAEFGCTLNDASDVCDASATERRGPPGGGGRGGDERPPRGSNE